MPFKLTWHHELPVLIVTYQGTLTRREYEQLCAERATLLSAGPAEVALIADMREFAGFPEAEHMATTDHPQLFKTARSTIIVLKPNEYKSLFRAIAGDQQGKVTVYYIPDIDEALETAARLLS